ncbi:MAG TPA: hypothetical protein VFG72_07705 [Marmoricola sp.]|nr:hypothetical protein [Marmoricola sp.]
MTEEHHPERGAGARTDRSPTRSRSSWWPVIAPAGALLAGVLIGGVVVGVADDDDSPSADPQPSASPTDGEESESPAPGATTIVVPDECLAAVDTVEQATELTRKGAGAIRDFEPQQLRSLLRELEQLDQQAREQAQACRDVRTER